VPEHDDRSSRAWLFGKLLVTLWTKIDLHRARCSPSGYLLSARVWREGAANVSGKPLPGGHFLPEEIPDETQAALRAFLNS